MSVISSTSPNRDAKPVLRRRWFLVALAVSLYLGLCLQPARVHGGRYYLGVFIPVYVSAILFGVLSKTRNRKGLFFLSIALLVTVPFVAIPLMIVLINMVEL